MIIIDISLTHIPGNSGDIPNVSLRARRDCGLQEGVRVDR